MRDCKGLWTKRWPNSGTLPAFGWKDAKQNEKH